MPKFQAADTALRKPIICPIPGNIPLKLLRGLIVWRDSEPTGLCNDSFLFVALIAAAFFVSSLVLLNYGRQLGLRYLNQDAGNMACLATVEVAVFAASRSATLSYCGSLLPCLASPVPMSLAVNARWLVSPLPARVMVAEASVTGEHVWHALLEGGVLKIPINVPSA